MDEIWKPLPFLLDHEISNTGKARTIDRYLDSGRGKSKRFHKGINLTPSNNGYGYLIISVKIDKKRKNLYMHRLVATLFVENPRLLQKVNHRDGVKTNNIYSNLEWCTSVENTKHAIDNGLIKQGQDRRNAKFIIDLQTGIFYNDLNDAANAKGIKAGTLWTWLNYPQRNKSSFAYA